VINAFSRLGGALVGVNEVSKVKVFQRKTEATLKVLRRPEVRLGEGSHNTEKKDV